MRTTAPRTGEGGGEDHDEEPRQGALVHFRRHELVGVHGAIGGVELRQKDGRARGAGGKWLDECFGMRDARNTGKVSEDESGPG